MQNFHQKNFIKFPKFHYTPAVLVSTVILQYTDLRNFLRTDSIIAPEFPTTISIWLNELRRGSEASRYWRIINIPKIQNKSILIHYCRHHFPCRIQYCPELCSDSSPQFRHLQSEFLTYEEHDQHCHKVVLSFIKIVELFLRKGQSEWITQKATA